VASGGRAIPENPVFATESERLVWEALRPTLADGEVLIHGLRFSDRHAGDIEIDILLLSPQRGAAVIEVKGGRVEYIDGQWTTTNGSGTKRRIHPTDQARRAKHALRRYLDRQVEWDRGLLRSQWFLAMPFTEVVGDMGPEAHREQIIGDGDLTLARSIIDEGMEALRREPPVPEGPWVDDAVRLISEAPDMSLSDARSQAAAAASGSRHVPTGVVVGLVLLASAGLAAGLTLAFGWWGALAAGVTVAVVFLALTRLLSRQETPGLPTMVGAGLGAAVLAAGSVLAFAPGDDGAPPLERIMGTEPALADTGCMTEYEPCVLQMPEDRDCPDLGFRVFLTGTDDPYGLDRDGNGIGCESYPERPGGESPGQ